MTNLFSKPFNPFKITKIIQKPVVDNCPICLEKMADGFMETICKHKFHQSCWDEYISSSTDGINCPMCRHCITPHIKWGRDYYLSMVNDVIEWNNELILSGLSFHTFMSKVHLLPLTNPEIMEDGSPNGYNCYYNISIKMQPESVGFKNILLKYTGVEITNFVNNYLIRRYDMIHITMVIRPDNELGPEIYFISKPVMDNDETPLQYQMAKQFNIWWCHRDKHINGTPTYFGPAVCLNIATGEIV